MTREVKFPTHCSWCRNPFELDNKVCMFMGDYIQKQEPMIYCLDCVQKGCIPHESEDTSSGYTYVDYTYDMGNIVIHDKEY